MRIEIDGKEVPDLWNCAVRWWRRPDGTPAPALYYAGKRVTRPWKIVGEESSQEDKFGASA